MKKTTRATVGLSEHQIKQRLLRDGWEVWRGGAISIVRKDDIYPNVVRKYNKLCLLIEKYHPDSIDKLQLLCDVHHGMPDFIAFRHGQFKFVECKLQHEQIARRQKVCMERLQAMGFPVEVHRLVNEKTKVQTVRMDLYTNHKIIIEKQLRLTKKLMASSS